MRPVLTRAVFVLMTRVAAALVVGFGADMLARGLMRLWALQGDEELVFDWSSLIIFPLGYAVPMLPAAVVATVTRRRAFLWPAMTLGLAPLLVAQYSIGSVESGGWQHLGWVRVLILAAFAALAFGQALLTVRLARRLSARSTTASVGHVAEPSTPT